MATEISLISILEEIECLRPYARKIAVYLRGRQWSERRAIAIFERFSAFADWAVEIERHANQEGSPRTVLQLPILPLDLAAYARWLASDGKSMATISSYVSDIGTMHTAADLSNPTASVEVKNVLSELRQSFMDDDSNRARALLEPEIRKILNTLYTPRITRGGAKEIPKGARRRANVDKALLLTMIQAGMRRVDAANLSWGDIREAEDGSGVVLLDMVSSSVHRMWLPITEGCMDALKEIKPEDVNYQTSVFNLSGNQINRRIKRMCAEAGLDPTGISGDTPRETLRRILRDSKSPVDVFTRQLRLKPPDSVFVETIDEKSYFRLDSG